ncbi:hypothetical protein FQR65_LT10047 [Abscondita terminalis]|nr:hypothetical protein FQR65_LT10047 [Abscondita terminalis]
MQVYTALKRPTEVESSAHGSPGDDLSHLQGDKAKLRCPKKWLWCVTGGNKGIGYEIVKGLCKQLQGKVYLTARDETRGKQALTELKYLGFNPEFHQLDITDQDSVDKFQCHIKENDGGIDVLVNNAAIAFKADYIKTTGALAEATVATNYFGTVRLCEALFPLLRHNAQVVHVSSSVGHLSCIPSSDLKSKLSDPQLTVNKLNTLMNQFVSDVKNNTHETNGWSKHAYSTSKVGLSALTLIHQREFNADVEQRNVSVNSVHPGYVNTDMTNHTGPLTPEEGARAPLFLALGGHGLKGKYVWRDCTLVDWFGEDLPARY